MTIDALTITPIVESGRAAYTAATHEMIVLRTYGLYSMSGVACKQRVVNIHSLGFTSRRSVIEGLECFPVRLPSPISGTR